MGRRFTLLLLGAAVCGAVYAATARATPSSGFTAATLAKGTFGEIDVKNLVPNDSTLAPLDAHWQARLKTQGTSDLYVQSNVWTPGGTTGWHTHPGHSLIIVTAGTVTAYDGDDPACTPHVYTQGMGFVDAGGDHVHLIRNEGAVEARTVAVQLIPTGAARRIDSAAPGNCGF
jgi:quercetin dioxygenase-like cupin family protein